MTSMHLARFAGICAVATAGITGSALAATVVDFTDSGQWSGSDAAATTSQTYGHIVIDLTSDPAGQLNFSNPFDGTTTPHPDYCSTSGGPLACLTTGIGVGDDEIAEGESVTVDFTRSVGGAANILGLHFLKLYQDVRSDDLEQAVVYRDGDTSTALTFSAIFGLGTDAGHRFSPVAWTNVRTLTFVTGPGNDGRGRSDYALAALVASPIPLPPAAWLLLGGVGGLGLLRRRKAAARDKP